jgi:serine/threonine-protein kinase
MMAHQTKEPMPIRELAPEVPDGLAEVVTRLMAKTAEGRYTGCDELVEALEPFLGDLNQIQGGIPNTRSSGARPGLSSGGRPGLGSRSNPGAKVTLPSRSSTGVQPGGSGDRPRPAPAQPAPNVRTPNPQPTRGPSNVPSRASFQLPGIADDSDTGDAPRTRTPAEPARALPKLPTRGATGARPAAQPAPAVKPVRKAPAPQLEAVEEFDEAPAWASDNDEEKKSNLGTIGIVVVAVVLMVAVYFGATLLMK